MLAKPGFICVVCECQDQSDCQYRATQAWSLLVLRLKLLVMFSSGSKHNWESTFPTCQLVLERRARILGVRFNTMWLVYLFFVDEWWVVLHSDLCFIVASCQSQSLHICQANKYRCIPPLIYAVLSGCSSLTMLPIFYLSNARRVYWSMGKLCSLMD